MGISFVGVTHPHATARYRGAISRPDIQVRGAWDADPDVLAAFCDAVGARPLTREEAVAASEVDAAFVHSDSRSITSLAVELAEAGKHVLVEKPGGSDLRDLRELARAHQHGDIVMRVGYQFHFAESMERARRLVRQEAIGHISLLRGHAACSRGEHRAALLNQDHDMGGGLWIIGSHVIHPMLDLFGVPVAVRATVEKLEALSDATSREDVASLALLYPDRLATLDFTVHENGNWFESSELHLYGSQGQIAVGLLPERLSVQQVDDQGRASGWSTWSEGAFAVPWTGAPSPTGELHQVANRVFFDRELDEFVGSIKSSRTHGGVDPQRALDVAAVIDAAYRSAGRGGVSVEVDATIGG